MHANKGNGGAGTACLWERWLPASHVPPILRQARGGHKRRRWAEAPAVMIVNKNGLKHARRAR
jgi:hypothetical protein